MAESGIEYEFFVVSSMSGLLGLLWTLIWSKLKKVGSSPDLSFDTATFVTWLISVWLIGMFIPDPDFYPSRISDPGSKNGNNKKRGEKKLS
jgi:hypothetical protein